jgi:hypothetical protein
LRAAIHAANARLQAADYDWAVQWLERFKARVGRVVSDPAERELIIFFTENRIDALECL